MIIIVDASIVISAVMNPLGKEAAFILDHHNKIELVAPEFIFEEVNSKKEKIIAGSHHNHYSLNESLRLLYDKISVFSVDTFKPDTLKIAEQLTHSIDINDVQYIALTIYLEGLFWTRDLKLLRGIKRKGFGHVITTLDFQQILKGL